MASWFSFRDDNGTLYIDDNSKSDEISKTDDDDNGGNDIPDTIGRFVCVKSRKRLLGDILGVANEQCCVMVEGVGGCGKSALIHALASRCGRGNEVVTVHMSDQIDGKTLLGAITCTDVPGEFQWSPGVLTKAVTQGHWLILEDIDRCPSDVLSILIPLVKRWSLRLPGYHIPITPTKDFRLFMTRRLLKGNVKGISHNCHMIKILENHMITLPLPSYSTDEIIEIVCHLNPGCESVIQPLVMSEDEGIKEKVGLRKMIKLGRRVLPFLRDGRVTPVDNDDVILAIKHVFINQESEMMAEMMNIMKLYGGPISREEVKKLCIRLVASAIGSVNIMLRADSTTGAHPFFSLMVQSHLLLHALHKCVSLNEPALLVGETGVGKTAAVSYLSSVTGNKLVTINLSYSTDSIDLLGGFKPVPMAHLISPLKSQLERLLIKTGMPKTSQFPAKLQDLFNNKNWKKFLEVCLYSITKAKEKLREDSITKAKEKLREDSITKAKEKLREDSITKAKEKLRGKQKLVKKLVEHELVELELAELELVELESKLFHLKKSLDRSRGVLAFEFVEGALVEAVKRGWWILLDEINLASPETLQCLSSILEDPHGSFILTEKSGGERIVRHDGFRLFCCMNPATDVGKRSLPSSIIDRFTTIHVNEPHLTNDWRELIEGYLSHCDVSKPIIEGIIEFYRTIKDWCETKLEDGTGRRPHYSMRSLCRSLVYASNICKKYAVGKYAVGEDAARKKEEMIRRLLYEGLLMSFYSQLHQKCYGLVSSLAAKCLSLTKSDKSHVLELPLPSKKGEVNVEGYSLPKGTKKTPKTEDTDTPQGDAPKGYILTPSIRNNLRNLSRIIYGCRHPILLQGPTSAGKTSLVRYLAERTGHTCVRINNHEHTDLQEYIGMWSTSDDGSLEFKEGVLVTAMRRGHWIILDELNLAPTDVLEALNRVLDDNRELFIPETQEVVKAHPDFMLFGTQNPPGTYGGRKLLSRAFRNRFIELHYEDIPSCELIDILQQKCSLPLSYSKKMVEVMRELQQLRSTSGIFEGKYGLITLRDLFRWAERYRRSVNKKLYDWQQMIAEDGYMILAGRLRESHDSHVIIDVIKKHFNRTVDPNILFTTGGLAGSESVEKITEPLPGGFQRLVWTSELLRVWILMNRAIQFDEPVLLVGPTGSGKTTLCQLMCTKREKELYSVGCHGNTEAGDFLGGLRPVRDREDDDRLFQWYDGALVMAMKGGACLLVDEISLADDAVLERLNSVLEPDRKLLVAERGMQGEKGYEVKAKDGFMLVGTMNPGGDYGKKELSPSLRNRFLEIWCPQPSTDISYKQIIDHNLSPHLRGVMPWSSMMMEFIGWLKGRVMSSRFTVTIRDVLMWVEFMNKLTPPLSPSAAFHEGAQMIFVDAIGCGGSSDSTHLLSDSTHMLSSLSSPLHRNYSLTNDSQSFGIGPYLLSKGQMSSEHHHHVIDYCMTATGPSHNMLRLLRALQLPRPLLLEGPPGVGKTSLVSAIARVTRHYITRINLSEHTDISDLFGSDLPVEDSGCGLRFQWKDGPLLHALRNSHWILIDEMNLANQSVLEGLNSCLDHRGEIYISELCKRFTVPIGSKIFACQNPQREGGGRKGLPRSFVNRFTQVFMESMSHDDLVFIASSLYPSLLACDDIIDKMVCFNDQVRDLCRSHGNELWEFNLRDVLRWCQVINASPTPLAPPSLVIGMALVYMYRLRNANMRRQVYELYSNIVMATIDAPPLSLGHPFHISHRTLLIGGVNADRGLYCQFDEEMTSSLYVMSYQLPYMEAMLLNVKMNWMTILVGPSCSGKLSLVRALAELGGHMLVEYPVGSDTDTTELMGGFEQVNYNRHLCNVSAHTRYLIRCLKTHLMRGKESCDGIDETLESFNKGGWGEILSSSWAASNDGIAMRCDELMDKLANALTTGKGMIVPHHIMDGLREMMDECKVLKEKVGGDDECGQFEWVDSILATAIRRGHWVVMTHANFCSPSVLDRLNPLLEPNGLLTIDERGATAHGSITTITPHQDFRLFLTMDPSHGELSRAMRNRGIEIYLHNHHHDNDNDDESQMIIDDHKRIIVNDVMRDPSEYMVRREIRPLVDAINAYGRSVSVNGALKVYSQFRLFLRLTTLSTIDHRLKTLDKLGCSLHSFDPFIHSIVMATADLLRNHDYTSLSHEVITLMESILGTCYDGHIDVSINPSLYLNVIGNNQRLKRIIQRLQMVTDLKHLVLLHQRLLILHPSISWSNDSTIFHWTDTSHSHCPSPSSVLNVSTTNMLSDVIINVISETIQLINDDVIIDDVIMTQVRRGIDCMRSLILTCHMTRESSHMILSSLAIGWELLIHHSIDPIRPLLSYKLISDINILSDELSHLISADGHIISAFRSSFAPSIPHSGSHISILSALRCHDDVSLPSLSPLGILTTPIADKRRNVFELVYCHGNYGAALSLLGELSNSCREAPPTGLHPFMVASALHHLKELFLCRHGNHESLASFIRYCVGVAGWPLTSLVGVAASLHHQDDSCDGNDDNMASPSTSHYMELMMSDNQLMSFTGNGCGLEDSLTHLCQSFLSGCGLATPIEARTSKMSSLHLLLQFLSLHGFSSSHHLPHVFCNEVKVLHVVMETIVAALSVAMGGAATDTSNDKSLLEQLQGISVKLKAGEILTLYPLDQIYPSVSPYMMRDISHVKIHMSLSLLSFLAPTSPIDPVIIKHSRISSLNQLVEWYDVYGDSHRQHMDGWGGDNHEGSHGMRDGWMDDKIYWELKLEEIGEGVELTNERVESDRYDNMVNDVKYLLELLGDHERVWSMAGYHGDQVTNWYHNISSAVGRLRSSYPHHNDLIQPFSAAITMLSNGVTSLSHFNSTTNESQKSLYTCLIRFPYWYGNESMDIGDVQRIKDILSLYKQQQPVNSFKLLSIAVQLSLQLFSSMDLSMESKDILYQLLDECHSLWLKGEEKEKARKALEDSLYRYKPIITDITDDGEGNNEVHDIFASYDCHFLADDDACTTDTTDTADTADTAATGQQEQFTADQMMMIKALHQLVYTGACPKGVCLSSSLGGYMLANEVFMSGVGGPCGDVGNHRDIGGHLMTCHRVLVAMTTNNHEGSFMIYKDPCVTEAVKVLPLMESLMRRVHEVMEEWPDYPSLKRVLWACQQVMRLDMWSPLMKILTGLEHVLQQAQEWENYSSSRLSLSSQLAPITQLILHWRKLELNCWNDLLDLMKDDMARDECHWWFDMYSLLMEGGGGGGGDSHDDEILHAMMSYIEGCTLGQYNDRLEMLFTYSRDIHISERIRIMMENMYMYYRQFVGAVNEAIDKLAHPIMKEFKEFISIMKWNDSNYWSIRESVNKSHRGLTRHMTKYKGILGQPVRQVLSTGSLGHDQSPTTGDSSSLQTYMESMRGRYDGKIMEDDIDIMIEIAIDEGLVLNGREVTHKMNQLITGYIQSQEITGWVECMDESISDIITIYHELQSNDGLPSDKEKRLTAVKLLMMKRRGRLSDLFKMLKEQGYSYRKGEESLVDVRTMAFTSSPLPQTTPLNRSSNFYFHRCISRYLALDVAMAMPSKELMANHVTRMKGHSRQFLHLLCQERNTLFDAHRYVDQFKHMCWRLEMYNDHGGALDISVDDVVKWMSIVLSLICQCVQVVDSSCGLMESFPDGIDVSLSPSPPSSLPPIISGGITSHHLSVAVSDMMQWREKLNDKLKHLTDLEDKMATHQFYFITKYEVDNISDGFELIKDFKDNGIQHFISQILGDKATHLGIFEYLSEMMENINSKLDEFNAWNDVICQSTNQKVPVTCEAVTSLMLSIQKIITRHREVVGGADTPTHMALHEFVSDNVRNISSDKVMELLMEMRGEGVDGLLPILRGYMCLMERIWDEMVLVHRTMGKMVSVILEIWSQLVAKGYCVPPELMEGEGLEGEEFVDIEAGGFDEGEGNNDVSDKVDRNNLDTGGGGATSTDDQSDQRNADDDKGIEMGQEDFDGTMEDVPEREDEGSSGDEGEELEKKMGVVGNDDDLTREQEEERLDRNMWAESDAEDEEKMEKKSGGGREMEGEETRMMARDDALDNGGEKEREKERERERIDRDEGEGADDVNELDEYFNGGKDTSHDQQDMTDDQMDDFGDLNLEEDEDIDGSCEQEEEMEVDDDNLEGKSQDMEGEDEMIDGENHEEQAMDDDELPHPPDNNQYHPDNAIYGVPQSQVAPSQNESNTDSIMDSLHHQDHRHDNTSSCDQPNASTGAVTSCGADEGTSFLPRPSLNKERRRGHTGSHSNTPRSLADLNDKPRPAKRPRLMEGTNEGRQDKEEENDGSSRDDGVASHAYQHVDEDETCDDTAWDDAGGGGGTEGRKKDYMMNDDDDDDGHDGHNDKMADDNMTMADGHYQLREAKDNVNGDGDGVMEGDDISDDVIEEEEINVDEKNEREIPIDNFYNSPLTASSDMRSMDEARLRECMKTSLQYIHSNPQVADGECIRLWMTYEQMTSSLSHSLCEELRLMLTPTETAQLKGDYRSGKRLNMRRIISYIASNFQNDRIWLKRCKPSKRDYQVLIAVDDSSSMMENNCGQMTYESLALISTALQRLECGQLGICRFGEDVDVLHSFDNSFSSFHGGHVLKNLSFTQNKTNFVKLLQCAASMFGESLLKGRQSSVNINQLLVILSDGWIFADGTSPIERGIRDLNDMGVFTVFIIIDQGKNSVVNMTKVTTFPGKPQKIVRTNYLETFPFSYYIVLREISGLPLVLSQALRQWFQLITLQS